MGFERTTIVVNETDGRVELCFNVTVPAGHNLNGVTFDLTLEMQNGTASMSNKIVIVLTANFYQSNRTHTCTHTILYWLE